MRSGFCNEMKRCRERELYHNASSMFLYAFAIMFVYAFTERTASHLSHAIYVLDPKQVAITSRI